MQITWGDSPTTDKANTAGTNTLASYPLLSRVVELWYLDKVPRHG